MVRYWAEDSYGLFVGLRKVDIQVPRGPCEINTLS